MLGGSVFESIIHVIGFQLESLVNIESAAHVMAVFFPRFPGENLDGQVRAEMALGDGVLCRQLGALCRADPNGTRSCAPVRSGTAACPPAWPAPPCASTARFIQEIVGDIGLEPGEDLHTKRGTGVPTVELLILVVVVLKVNGRIEGGLLEIVAHFNELPSAVGIFFLLLRHGWKRETQTADYHQQLMQKGLILRSHALRIA